NARRPLIARTVIWKYPGGHDLFGPKTRIHLSQQPQAPYQEARPNDEHDCQADLTCYQQAAEPNGPCSPGLVPASLQRLDQIQPRRANSGSDSEDQPGEDCKPGHE